MSDYGKLVEALRWRAKPIPCSKTECPRKNTDEDCACHVLQDAAAAIEALEAEVKQLEPKRGEWIYDGKFLELNKFYCSKCKRTEFCMSDFCPNCGADMRDTEADNG